MMSVFWGLVGATTPLAAAHGDGSFSWTRFEIHPSVLIGCLALAIGYLAVIGPLRRRRARQSVSRWRVLCFLLGLLVLFLALNGPIHDLSDNYLFSAHMLQHMLLMLIMPPLLLLGVPRWLFAGRLRRGRVERVARLVTHPLLAYVAYCVVFIGWHIPRFYNWALVDHDLHILQHLMFMTAATLMWWPVINPVPALQRIPEGLPQMAYLFAYSIPTVAISAFIAMSDTVLYPWYESSADLFGLTPLEDQRLGGLIMWIPGMLVFWIAITAIFFRWNLDEIRSWGEVRRSDSSSSGQKAISDLRY